MKNVLGTIAVGCALAMWGSAYAAGEMGGMDMGGSATQVGEAAAGMSHGEVKKIDAAAGKLTIKHGPLDNLGMGAMTMVFRVKDPAMISQVAVGDKIDFVAEDLNGALTVTTLRKK